MAGILDFISAQAAASTPKELIDYLRSVSIPDRGYGYRYGTTQVPDTDSWGGTIPPNDSPIKGNGYYGILRRKDGSNERSSEISIGIEVNGNKYHVPTMVPGLTKEQLNYLLKTPEDQIYTSNKKLMSQIEQNAANWAKKRLEAGLPVFATLPEEGSYKPGSPQPSIEEIISKLSSKISNSKNNSMTLLPR